MELSSARSFLKILKHKCHDEKMFKSEWKYIYMCVSKLCYANVYKRRLYSPAVFISHLHIMANESIILIQIRRAILWKGKRNKGWLQHNSRGHN